MTVSNCLTSSSRCQVRSNSSSYLEMSKDRKYHVTQTSRSEFYHKGQICICVLSCKSCISTFLSDISFKHSSSQSASKRLFFARDPLGRRSLLIHRPTDQQPYFFLASVSAGSDLGEMKELSTEYIYSLDLGRLSNLQDVRQLLALPPQ